MSMLQLAQSKPGAFSLPLLVNVHWSQNQQQINAVDLDARGKHRYNAVSLYI